jgi:uncharacterized protein
MKRRRWMTALGVVVGIYVLLCVVGHFSYRTLLYPAPIVPASVAPDGAVDLYAQTSDGTRAHGWWFSGHGKTLVVMFHGNGETIDHGVDRARALVARGFDVLLAEYRGYGNSEGKPTEAGLYADADALIAATHVAPADLVIWGTSLGTGVSTEMAKRGKCRALVLVAPFTSIPDVGQRIARILPMRLIVTDQFDSLSKAPSVDVPVLIIHGTADEVVPYDMGVTLSRTFPHATLMSIDGGHHNDLFVSSGPAITDAIVEHASLRR